MYNLNHINDKYHKRGRVYMIGISKKDVVYIVQQFFNYLTCKTMVSFEWSIEKKK